MYLQLCTIHTLKVRPNERKKWRLQRKFCQEDSIVTSLITFTSNQSCSNTCSIKDRYLHMSEFADADAYIHLHPPHHHQDGPFPYLPGGRLRPCLRLQAGNADSATLGLHATDGAVINICFCYIILSPESFLQNCKLHSVKTAQIYIQSGTRLKSCL